MKHGSGSLLITLIIQRFSLLQHIIIEYSDTVESRSLLIVGCNSIQVVLGQLNGRQASRVHRSLDTFNRCL